MIVANFLPFKIKWNKNSSIIIIILCNRENENSEATGTPLIVDLSLYFLRNMNLHEKVG